MATITSPRIASPLPTPNSSRRTSLDTLSRSNTGSPAQAAAPIPPAQARRNRTALRDYYGLKTQVAPASDTASLQEQRNDGEIPEGKLDAPGFEPEKYVKEVLEREGLEELLKEEGGLMSGR